MGPPPEEDRRDYDVEGVLREGWGGTLLAGRYRRTGRRVTVERLRADLVTTPGFVERLAALGARAAAVSDEHLLAVYNLVETGGTLELVSEWSAAPTLEYLLRQRPEQPREAALIIDDVLAGLAALHQAGLAHGHVSTETVVVDPGGRARLAEVAVCAAADSTSGDAGADVHAAATLGLALLRPAGRWVNPLRRALAPGVGTPGSIDAARLGQGFELACERALGREWRTARSLIAEPPRQRRRWPVVAVAATVVLAAAAGVAVGFKVLGGGSSPPPRAGPLVIGADAALTVTPSRGGCDTTFVFVGRGSLSGVGTLVYRWEQSDGQSTADTPLTITADEGAFQLTQAWRIQGAQTLDASMALHLLKPLDHVLRQTFHYACS